MFSKSNLTIDFLESKRAIADPLADNTISAIIDEGYEERINEIFITLHRNSSFSKNLLSNFPERIQQIVANYFEESGRMPEWADKTLIEQGQQVFSEYGPEVFMLLNLKSLPMCYSCANGAEVLYDTGRLVEHNGQIDPLIRRLMETAQMVVNALQPGGLAPEGEGIITVQKVRLIHASIRHFLKSPKFNANGWDINRLGEPINQEDLAGTLMSFSPIILSGLKQLNIALSEQQIAAYTHCWKVIGHLIGLNSDLLADSFEDNWELASAILKHQAAESKQGKALTDSCLAFIKHMIPGNLFDEVPEYLIWFFFQDIQKAVNKPLTEMIGIRDHSSLKDHLILKFSQIVSAHIAKAEHHILVQKMTGEFNKLMLQGYIRHYNDGKRVRFVIPPSLTENWGINHY